MLLLKSDWNSIVYNETLDLTEHSGVKCRLKHKKERPQKKAAEQAKLSGEPVL